MSSIPTLPWISLPKPSQFQTPLFQSPHQPLKLSKTKSRCISCHANNHQTNKNHPGFRSRQITKEPADYLPANLTISDCGFPITLRILKMKRKLASDAPESVPVSTVSSIVKSISSVLLMIDELSSLIYKEDTIRSSLISRRMSDSLVVLFNKIFFKSPNLFLWNLELVADLVVHTANGSIGSKSRRQIVDYDSIDTFRDKQLLDRRRDAYERMIFDDPKNPLILANYAQFLYQIAKNNDKAEEMFVCSIKAEPLDAEAFSQYAMFLWKIRGDMEAAEETFLKAIDVEPQNCYHDSKYASFLWETGGTDTCLPFSSSS